LDKLLVLLAATGVIPDLLDAHLLACPLAMVALPGIIIDGTDLLA
jgi:hypothetical protein